METRVISIGAIATAEDVQAMILFHTKAGYKLAFITDRFLVFLKPEPKEVKEGRRKL
jgi:hypothetical protein